MKKTLCAVLALMLAAMCACAAPKAEEPQETPMPTVSAEPAPQVTTPTIALVMGETNEFYDTVISYAKAAAEKGGYELKVINSATDSAQENDIYSVMGMGITDVLLIPVNMDNLQTVLDDCGIQNVTVVNMMIPVNGVVASLAAPDYKNVGSQAAACVSSAFGEETAAVLTVEAVTDSFISQLMHDGFDAAAVESGNVYIADSILVSENSDSAYAETVKALAKNTAINCVFAADEVFEEGVLKAAEECGRAVKTVCVGGSDKLVSDVKSGKLLACVAVCPKELAEEAVNALINSADGDIAQYIPVRVFTIDKDSAESYAEGSYAVSAEAVSLAEEQRLKKAEEEKAAQEAAASQTPEASAVAEP